MNIKFIALAILLVLIYVGYPKYRMMEREDAVRAFLKGPFIADVQREKQPQAALNGFEMDVLNQYPNFRIYQKYHLEASKLPKLPANIDQLMKKGMCEQMNLLTTFYEGNPKDLQALKNVFEEDKVTFILIVQDKFGQEIVEFKQQISECSKLDLETSKTEKTQQATMAEPVEAAPAATAPAEAAASVN